MPHPQSVGDSWESGLVVVVGGEWFPADGLCGTAASSPTSQHWPGSPVSQCWPGQEFCSGSNTVSALRELMVWWETQTGESPGDSLWVVCLNRCCRHVVRNCKLCGRLCANLPLVPVSCSPAPPQRAALSARTTPPEMVYAFKSRFPLETKQNLSCILHRQQPLSAFFTDQHF